MKVNLVVASGVHQGKVIPITGPQFLIGRDAQCHLRPASQAISKRHCGVFVRDGKVYIKDFGSTNGTTVNDELIKDAEVVVEDGASLKLGPLDFTVRVEKTAVHPDGTPLPAASPETAAALAAVKATAGAKPAAARDATPNPARPAKPGTGSKEAPALKPGSKEAPALTGSKEAAALKDPTPGPTLSTSESGDEEQDRIAAMLLGMDDGGEVPDGSTVMDMPSGLGGENKTGEAGSGDGKTDDKSKKTTSREEMTSAASEALRKMMRRPK
jgi:pSer/pThr/pTyr-binding forkhead associated (FHA) protein